MEFDDPMFWMITVPLYLLWVAVIWKGTALLGVTDWAVSTKIILTVCMAPLTGFIVWRMTD